jgi:AcrR family transcriptional regulator
MTLSDSLPSGSKPSPRGKKGERTRARLIDAARRVFERDGYLDARVLDITAEAGMSSGSFYTYFEDKDDIFAAVVDKSQDKMLHPGLAQRLGSDDPEALVDGANRDYVESVRKNARLLALFEQVAHIDDDFKEMGRKRAKEFALRNAKMIERLQDEGRADPEVDPFVAAHALSAMVGRMAFIVYILGEQIPFEHLISTLNRLWANALRMDAPTLTGGSGQISNGSAPKLNGNGAREGARTT